MSNPIVERELIGLLRSRRALAIQVLPAAVFALLVLARWPTDAQVGLSGVQAQSVFRLFGYGLLVTLLMMIPAFPATTLVHEKIQGTLALLLNSPMTSVSIYAGKLIGVLGFVFLPLAMSLPAAAACYAMGGISMTADVGALYVVLAIMTLQFTALGLLVGTYANTTDGALRTTYGLVLMISVVFLGPHRILQGKSWPAVVTLAEWMKAMSPIPAVMEILGHGNVGAQGLVSATGAPGRYALAAGVTTVVVMIWTAARLKQTMFDRPRPQGVITDERSTGQRWLRRLMFLIDPQRRKSSIGPLSNPVTVKEFRARRFGRSHWMVRLVAGCAVLSLLLTYAATTGTLLWGPESIGGIMVLLQVGLIVLLTPSLSAGLFSSEHENGGWILLRMTPLSARRILQGKLISVVWTLLLILLATLPGYAVMMYIKPVLKQQIYDVLICLVLAALFALLLGATVSSFFRRTAPATVVSYTLLLIYFGGTMLFWLGRNAPFGHEIVERVLMVNPMAAALTILELPGFSQYELLPTNWWIVGGACLLCLCILTIRTWRLTRPQ